MNSNGLHIISIDTFGGFTTVTLCTPNGNPLTKSKMVNSTAQKPGIIDQSIRGLLEDCALASDTPLYFMD